jgi:hypothetical protein
MSTFTESVGVSSQMCASEMLLQRADERDCVCSMDLN